jgi:putative tryptophan/tyrosine transport system substrate-binding protein
MGGWKHGALPARNASELENSVATFARTPNGGLLVLPDTFTTVNRKLIISLAEQCRLPTIYPLDQFTAQGGLISYGPDLVDLYVRAPRYVDRILKGAAPADLPVQQPNQIRTRHKYDCFQDCRNYISRYAPGPG